MRPSVWSSITCGRCCCWDRWVSVALQVHGHDFAAVAALPGCDAYASASEEKVVRILEAPQVAVVFFPWRPQYCKLLASAGVAVNHVNFGKVDTSFRTCGRCSSILRNCCAANRVPKPMAQR